MIVSNPQFLIRNGAFAGSRELEDILSDIRHGIQDVVWPPGNDRFVIYPGCAKDPYAGGEDTRNGVKPIKDAFIQYLVSRGWQPELRMKLAAHKQPGKVDAVLRLSTNPDKVFLLEWETGNISSSHRALNKMSVGLLDGSVAGGVLIVPTRNMYKHLTDRVGNYEELEPYFPIWRNLNVQEGVLAVIAIEQDGVDPNVPRIEKGTDGWALIERH